MYKRTLWYCLLIALLLSVSTRASLGISLTEYTFPVSKSQIADISGTFNSNGSSLDSTHTGYNLVTAVTYNYNFRSLPFTYQFTTNNFLSFVRGTDVHDSVQSSFELNASTRANKYLWNDKKWYSFGAFNYESIKKLTRMSAYKPAMDVEIGAGYGRTIDATVLKQAVRISEEFKRFQVTKGEISDETLLKLARIIDQKNDYITQYGDIEYNKYWYNAMEDVLRESEVLVGDRLGAIGALRIQEVLNEPTGIRTYGWEVRSGIGVVLSDTNGKKGDPLLTMEFDWAHPVNIKLQLNNSIYAHRIFNSDSAFFDFGNKFEVYYELSNRIHWDNQLDLRDRLPSTSGIKSSFAGSFISTFSFYIENQLSFDTSVNVTNSMTGNTVELANWVFSTGIKYRVR